jgi:hypothetical protein
VDSATPYYPFCLYCPEHLGNDSPEAHNLRLHPESYVIPGLERWQVPFAERRADAAPAEAPPV